MATSLNIGYWSWQHRWRYPDEPDYKPGDEAPSYQGKTTTLPAVPVRLREDHDMQESMYTSQYMQPPRKHAGTMFADIERGQSLIPSDSTSKNLRRLRAKKPAPRTFQNHHLTPFWDESPEDKRRVPPGEMPFRLWGRINTAYCVVPYHSETQKAYPAYRRDQLDAPGEDHNMKVIRKDYKEAIAKAKNIEKDILANAGKAPL